MPVPQLLASVFLRWGAWVWGGVRPSAVGGSRPPLHLGSVRASPVKEGGQEAPQQDLVPRARADVAVHELRPRDVHIGAWSGEQEGGRGPQTAPFPTWPSPGLGPAKTPPDNSPRHGLVSDQERPAGGATVHGAPTACRACSRSWGFCPHSHLGTRKNRQWKLTPRQPDTKSQDS